MFQFGTIFDKLYQVLVQIYYHLLEQVTIHSKNKGNMIVSLASGNNFCEWNYAGYLSIVFVVYAAHYLFAQLFYNLVLKWYQFEMLELIMYVYVDVYSLYVEICWMFL